MSITYRYGEGEVKALAAQAGKAQAAREQVNKRFQKDMAMIGYQMELEKQQRAMAWETEKMEISSRMDFQAKEQERVEKQRQFNTALGEIDKRRVSRGGTLPDEVADKATMNTALQFQGFPPADSLLGLTPYQEQTLAARSREQDYRDQQLALQEEKMKSTPEYLIFQKMQGLGGGVTPEPPTALESKPNQAGNLPRVSSKPVPLGSVAPKDVQTENGKFIVIAPDGSQETIRPDEYGWAIEQNYSVNPIIPSSPSFWEQLRPFREENKQTSKKVKEWWESLNIGYGSVNQ